MNVGISRPSRTPDEAHEVLDAARRHGFAGVQLKPQQYDAFVASPPAFAERYGPLAELARGGLIIYPGGDPAAWADRLEPVLAFAGAVGAAHVCVCSGVYGSGATDAQARTVAAALTDVGRRAGRRGVVISVHNHANSVVESESDIARLLDQLDPGTCGLTLDTAHAAKSGIRDVHRLVERFRGHLLNVHLKDLAADGTFCALGRGTLPLEPILAALAAVRYDQWLIVDEETASLDTDAAFGIAAEYLARHGVLPRPEK